MNPAIFMKGNKSRTSKVLFQGCKSDLHLKIQSMTLPPTHLCCESKTAPQNEVY